MKHPRFYKRTIHRRSGFSPAKSLFPPICCRAEALPAPDTFSVSAIFSDGLLPVAAYRPAFPARTLRRENPLRSPPCRQAAKKPPEKGGRGWRRGFGGSLRGAGRGVRFFCACGRWSLAAFGLSSSGGRRAGRRGRRARQGRMRRRQSGRQGFFVSWFRLLRSLVGKAA